MSYDVPRRSQVLTGTYIHYMRFWFCYTDIKGYNTTRGATNGRGFGKHHGRTSRIAISNHQTSGMVGFS